MSVTYRSTRGGSSVEFLDVALAGPAPDGGLYVPNEIPKVDEASRVVWKKLSFAGLGVEVISQFVADDQIPRADLIRLVNLAFSKFRVPDVAPLYKLSKNLYLMELFHGPTFAFKDVAMTMLAEFFDYILEKKDKKISILGATSGDTGSSAMAAMADRSRIRCLILYPAGRTSHVQEAQMLALAGRENSNVFCVPIKGTFDDCQRIVKECFGSTMKTKLGLAAVNSMNWVRVMTQIVYYWWAALHTDGKLIDVCVPTGNFGNALAAWFAREMGAPIRQIVIATNSNDILAQFISSGTYMPSSVKQTLSPSMDIQIASNFERFVDYLYNKDSQAVTASFELLSKEGKFHVPKSAHQLAQTQIFGFSSSDEETLQAITSTYKVARYVLDPHTAVAVSVCRRMGLPQGDVPVVVPATAHWAKFPDAIKTALGAEVYKTLEPPAELASQGSNKTPPTVDPNFKSVRLEINRKFGEIEKSDWWAIDIRRLVWPTAIGVAILLVWAGRGRK